MSKKLSALIFALLISVIHSAALQGGASDEGAISRPDKQEIINLMLQTGRMPPPEKNQKLDTLWKNAAASNTPRSDFLFCLALAYLGDYRAQRSTGSAYENARGIVEDLSEAYTWYSIALENQISDPSAAKMIEEDRERVKTKLTIGYPSPTDDELDEMVKAQKARIAQYREEANKAKK